MNRETTITETNFANTQAEALTAEQGSNPGGIEAVDQRFGYLMELAESNQVSPVVTGHLRAELERYYKERPTSEEVEAHASGFREELDGFVEGARQPGFDQQARTGIINAGSE